MTLTGLWILYEYYYEPEDELLHIKEEQLLKGNIHWEIEFDNRGIFRQKSNLPVKFFTNEKIYFWSLSQNFLNIITPEKDQKEVFQFALTKNQLRLLQKDQSGRIVFFGFFKKKAGI
jgi:hypothetical protein